MTFFHMMHSKTTDMDQNTLIFEISHFATIMERKFHHYFRFCGAINFFLLIKTKKGFSINRGKSVIFQQVRHNNHGATCGETFVFCLSQCGAKSTNDIKSIVDFFHLSSWRKLQKKKFWNFDNFWLSCGISPVERWPICRVLWRNVFLFWCLWIEKICCVT